MTVRCAIYTRKSTEEGLEQDFNSLDAQREACEAFIKSQKGLGWKAINKHYDDGGISGGTMDRPALKELLADIEAGKVDLVVVYKVDRLTRSLMDFAKIIETFDQKNVSFVSVTQQFNTANSMGRLTLNVLLSFAQFEREVTAERIRDKIAASKKKGMWMGGLPPLGFDAVDKKLVVNQVEAEIVRALFDLYLDHGSIRDLKAAADKLGYVTKRREAATKYTGGKPFTRGHLSQLLRNPIYIGKVTHRGEVFDGQHEAIIGLEIWAAVQKMLDGKAPDRRSHANKNHGCLLTGLLFDETGDRLTPSHTNKKGRRYKYYISSRLVTDPKATGGWRLPADELEATILSAVTEFLSDQSRWARVVDLSGLQAEAFNELLKRIEEMAGLLEVENVDRVKVLGNLVERVTVAQGIIIIRLRTEAICPCREGEGHDLEVPFQTKRRGVESKIVVGGIDAPQARPDETLIRVVQRSAEWWRLITEEEGWTIDKLSERASMPSCEVTRFLPLAFLAPDIVEAILHGKNPIDLNVERLNKLGPIPADWAAQKRFLGFETPSNI